MVWHTYAFDFDVTLIAFNLDAEAFITPVHCNKFLTCKVELVAQFTTWHEQIIGTIVEHMVFEISVDEVFFALLACKLLLQ